MMEDFDAYVGLGVHKNTIAVAARGRAPADFVCELPNRAGVGEAARSGVRVRGAAELRLRGRAPRVRPVAGADRARGGLRGGGNPCYMNVKVPPNALAFGHSHPYFTWDPKKTVEENGVTCNGVKLDSAMSMKKANEDGVNFSLEDMNAAKSVGKPLYLVVPERNVVKVYRYPENCPNCQWRVETL